MAQLTWYISASPVQNNDVTGSGGSNGNQTPNQESTDKNQNNSMTKTAGQMVALSVAKRTATYLVSNVGKYSGNSRNQVVANDVAKMVGYGFAFKSNPYITITAMTLDAVISGVDYAFEREWDKIRSDQAKARAGEVVGFRQ